MSDNIDQLQDYSFSRKTYYTLIKKGLESLDRISELAEESEHPRAFEVLAGFIKTVADTNDKLINLQMKNQALEDKQKEAKPVLIGEVENAIVFTGPVAEVLEHIEEGSKDGIEST